MSGGNTATLCSFFLAAALHVRLPDFIAVEQDFFAIRDGITGALAGAFIALVTKILQAEIDIFVRGQGHIGGDDGILETRPQERFEKSFSMGVCPIFRR